MSRRFCSVRRKAALPPLSRRPKTCLLRSLCFCMGRREGLEGAKGLRLGIVPAKQGESDAIEFDEARNLVICPLPYDRSFMQIFYEGWELMMAFLTADAKLPAEVNLPRPAARQVARYLVDRREFAVRDVIEALKPLAQPELLRTQQQNAAQTAVTRSVTTTTAVMAPMPRVG